MPILNKPTTLSRGSDNAFSIDKASLVALPSVSADPFWSDTKNWKSIVIVYDAVDGQQRRKVIFDATRSVPTANVKTSPRSRSAYNINHIAIIDFDGGSFKISASELNVSEFNLTFSAAGAARFIRVEVVEAWNGWDSVSVSPYCYLADMKLEWDGQPRSLSGMTIQTIGAFDYNAPAIINDNVNDYAYSSTTNSGYTSRFNFYVDLVTPRLVTALHWAPYYSNGLPKTIKVYGSSDAVSWELMYTIGTDVPQSANWPHGQYKRLPLLSAGELITEMSSRNPAASVTAKAGFNEIVLTPNTDYSGYFKIWKKNVTDNGEWERLPGSFGTNNQPVPDGYNIDNLHSDPDIVAGKQYSYVVQHLTDTTDPSLSPNIHTVTAQAKAAGTFRYIRIKVPHSYQTWNQPDEGLYSWCSEVALKWDGQVNSLKPYKAQMLGSSWDHALEAIKDGKDNTGGYAYNQRWDVYFDLKSFRNPTHLVWSPYGQNAIGKQFEVYGTNDVSGTPSWTLIGKKAYDYPTDTLWPGANSYQPAEIPLLSDQDFEVERLLRHPDVSVTAKGGFNEIVLTPKAEGSQFWSVYRKCNDASLPLYTRNFAAPYREPSAPDGLSSGSTITNGKLIMPGNGIGSYYYPSGTPAFFKPKPGTTYKVRIYIDECNYEANRSLTVSLGGTYASNTISQSELLAAVGSYVEREITTSPTDAGGQLYLSGNYPQVYDANNYLSISKIEFHSDVVEFQPLPGAITAPSGNRLGMGMQNSSTITDADVVPGASYTYVVRHISDTTPLESASSNTVTALPKEANTSRYLRVKMQGGYHSENSPSGNSTGDSYVFLAELRAKWDGETKSLADLRTAALQPFNEINKLTDGNLTSGSSGYAIINHNGEGWDISVDLGAYRNIESISLCPYGANYLPKRLTVYVSDDGKNWTEKHSQLWDIYPAGTWVSQQFREIILDTPGGVSIDEAAFHPDNVTVTPQAGFNEINWTPKAGASGFHRIWKKRHSLTESIFTRDLSQAAVNGLYYEGLGQGAVVTDGKLLLPGHTNSYCTMAMPPVNLKKNTEYKIRFHISSCDLIETRNFYAHLGSNSSKYVRMMNADVKAAVGGYIDVMLESSPIDFYTSSIFFGLIDGSTGSVGTMGKLEISKVELIDNVGEWMYVPASKISSNNTYEVENLITSSGSYTDADITPGNDYSYLVQHQTGFTAPEGHADIKQVTALAPAANTYRFVRIKVTQSYSTADVPDLGPYSFTREIKLKWDGTEQVLTKYLAYPVVPFEYNINALNNNSVADYAYSNINTKGEGWDIYFDLSSYRSIESVLWSVYGSSYAPKHMEILGSQDRSNWTTLHTQSYDIPVSSEWTSPQYKEIVISSPTATSDFIAAREPQSFVSAAKAGFNEISYTARSGATPWYKVWKKNHTVDEVMFKRDFVSDKRFFSNFHTESGSQYTIANGKLELSAHYGYYYIHSQLHLQPDVMHKVRLHISNCDLSAGRRISLWFGYSDTLNGVDRKSYITAEDAASAVGGYVDVMVKTNYRHNDNMLYVRLEDSGSGTVGINKIEVRDNRLEFHLLRGEVYSSGNAVRTDGHRSFGVFTDPDVTPGNDYSYVVQHHTDNRDPALSSYIQTLTAQPIATDHYRYFRVQITESWQGYGSSSTGAYAFVNELAIKTDGAIQNNLIQYPVLHFKNFDYNFPALFNVNFTDYGYGSMGHATNGFDFAFDFQSAKQVQSVLIYPYSSYQPKTMEFFGSNDGVTWVSLKQVAETTPPDSTNWPTNQYKEFII